MTDADAQELEWCKEDLLSASERLANANRDRARAKIAFNDALRNFYDAQTKVGRDAAPEEPPYW